MTTKIAFFDTKPYDQEVFERCNKDFKYEISFFKEHLNKNTVRLAEGHQVVCAFVNDQITKPIIDILLKYEIKLIALRSAGYNNVDLPAAKDKINIVRVPAYSPYAVAEHAMALILGLNRKIHKAYYRVRDNNFSINGLRGFDLHGKTIGIIGTGTIGKVMVHICKGFGMNVLAYDYYPDKDFAKETSIKYVDLVELYKQSDIITLHCPLTKETLRMIDTKSIDQMKDGVMLINTSRGNLIDSKALIKGLKSKKIGSAGLDVYEEEADYFFEDLSGMIMEDDVLARLISFNNVLITSHQAFFTEEALNNIAKTTLNNIKEFITNQKLTNEVCHKCQ